MILKRIKQMLKILAPRVMVRRDPAIDEVKRQQAEVRARLQALAVQARVRGRYNGGTNARL